MSRVVTISSQFAGNVCVLVTVRKLYVQYSQSPPDLGGRRPSPGGTKPYDLYVTDIPADGRRGALDIIAFVTPELTE